MTQIIKAITLHQPYATLIALGHKRFETRSWQTKYRGPIVIHAGRTLLYDERDRDFMSLLGQTGIGDPRKLPLGAGLAIGTLKKIYRTEDIRPVMERDGWQAELAFGNYQPRRFAWAITDVRLFPEPIPCKGYQGLWDWKLPLPEGFR